MLFLSTAKSWERRTQMMLKMAQFAKILRNPLRQIRYMGQIVWKTQRLKFHFSSLDVSCRAS